MVPSAARVFERTDTEGIAAFFATEGFVVIGDCLRCNTPNTQAAKQRGHAHLLGSGVPGGPALNAQAAGGISICHGPQQD